MAEPKYHYHQSVKVIEEKPDWNPSLPFELKLDFELVGGDLDISLVNGLRRTVYEDVPCLSVDPSMEMEVEKNITVFNTQYLKDRFSLQSVQLDNPDDVDKYRNIILRVCDPKDPDKPFVNADNKDRHITLNDLTILEEVGPLSEGQKQDLKQAESAQKQFTSPSTVEEPVKKKKTPAKPIHVHDPDEDIDDKIKENQEEGAEQQTASADALEDLAISEEDSGAIATAQDQPVPQAPVKSWKLSSVQPKDLFTYTDMYILTIKKGESIYAQMRLKPGIGKTHARWQSGIIIYGFKPAKSLSVDKWMDDGFDPIKNRQDYPRAKTVSGQYGTPETFQISIEYNGHYRPSMVWVSAIKELNQKIKRFQDLVRKTDIIVSVPGSKTDLSSKLKIESNPAIPNLLTMYLYGEDHTLGNIVFSHYLYLLHELVLSIEGESFKDEILKSFSHYRIPHPLDGKLVIMLRAPTWDRKTLDTGLKTVLTSGENTYDDDSIHPSIRLLMIALDRVQGLLQSLEKEAHGIYNQSKDGSLERVIMPRRLPQAEAKIKPKTRKEIEVNAEVALEEAEIVGEQEEAYQEAMDMKDLYNLDDVEEDDDGDDDVGSGDED